jgi:hypothetical protein
MVDRETAARRLKEMRARKGQERRDQEMDRAKAREEAKAVVKALRAGVIPFPKTSKKTVR